MSRSAALALAIAVSLPLGAAAQSRPTSAPATQPDKAKKKAEKKKKEEDRFFAVVGGTVHTVSGPVLEGATILCKNGTIAAIGYDLEIPAGAETLNAKGYRVYPGLVAVSSSGIVGSEPPEDSSDVFSLATVLALAGGITTTVTGNTAAKPTFGTLEGHVIKKSLFHSLNYATSAPDTRRKLRASLERVRQHLRDLDAHEAKKRTDPDAKAPDASWVRGDYAALLKLLRKETVAVATANTAHELVEICDLATRYGIRIVARGAREGWTVAPQMARAGVAAVVTPRTRTDRDEQRNRLSGSSITNAAVLYDHGVRLAIVPSRPIISTSGLAGRDLQHLPMEAAFAVRGGLANDVALRAITIDAARILGIDHRVGSIEVGKDADFAICDGDMLHYMTLVRWAVVNGRVAYDKQKETLFDHIRPNGDRDAPPPDDHWPRRLGAAW